MSSTTPQDLTPKSKSSRYVLPATGTHNRVVPALPIGVYANSTAFITGAVEQVAFTFRSLGGSVLDIELTDEDVYASYERAVLEYSYIINLYQAKSSLASFLGSPTGSFTAEGQIVSGSVLSGSNAALKYPRFSIANARRIGDEIAYEAGMGGTIPYYSASISVVDGVQDYDLQAIISSSADAGSVDYANLINNSTGARIRVNRVYYRSPFATWRFFGYYGGLSVVGNLNSYGQYADDSTFDVIPAWQNKLQAMAYKSNLYTRASHYSYEIFNNKIRLFPPPSGLSPEKIWFTFSLDPSPITEYVDNAGNPLGGQGGINGVNNINNLPFENIPYEAINSIGKSWIRRFALSVSKEVLSQIRGKLTSIPIPGNEIVLNYSMLAEQAKEEMEKLREELKQQLEETSYEKLAEKEANMVENASKTHQYIPKSIWVG